MVELWFTPTFVWLQFVISAMLLKIISYKWVVIFKWISLAGLSGVFGWCWQRTLNVTRASNAEDGGKGARESISLHSDQHRDCWHAHVFCACSPHRFVRCSIECKVETHFLIFYNFQIACLFLLILFTSRNVTVTYRTDFCPATDSSPSNINIDKPWKWINKKHALTWTTITRSRG